jgi:hypothetical protein
MMSDSLFKRERETLDDYTPVFTLEETLLGYKLERVQLGGGFKDFDFDPQNPRYEDRHSITVQEVVIVGRGYYGWKDKFEIAAEIANEFLAKDENRKRHHEVFAFFQINAENLNNSKRYWKSWTHQQKINAEKAKVTELLTRIARAEVIASVNALEVKAERHFSTSERQVLLAEFNGGEFKTDEES